MATEKMLRITMPDSSVWEVPAKVVAADRARYYAARDKDTTWQEEFDFAMGDAYELEDWAAGNMNWEDVVDHARKVSSPALEAPDFQEGWVNGDKEVVEVEMPEDGYPPETSTDVACEREIDALCEFVTKNLADEIGRGGSESAVEIAIRLLREAWGDPDDRPGPMRVARACEEINGMKSFGDLYEDGFALGVTYEPLCGYVGIEIGGWQVWQSEDDPRDYTNEEEGLREPLIDYLRRELRGFGLGLITATGESCDPTFFTCRECGKAVEVEGVRCSDCTAKKGPTL